MPIFTKISFKENKLIIKYISNISIKPENKRQDKKDTNSFNRNKNSVFSLLNTKNLFVIYENKTAIDQDREFDNKKVKLIILVKNR
nr:hypothetical protein [Clostridioides difficile]